MEESFIYQKFRALFMKHSADGTTPKKLIEAGISREFRLSKEECHRLLEGMDLEQQEMKKRRLRRTQPQYEEKSNETYRADLRTSR